MSERMAAEVFHPGEFVQEELEARGWTQSDLAEVLGRPDRLVSEIISGKRSVTPETAQGLGDAFGTGAQFWMNLESTYRLSKVDRDDAISRRALLYSRAPMKEMIRRGWIQDSDRIDVLEKGYMDFFGVDRVDRAPRFWPHAARKSADYLRVTPAQLAWLFRARHLACLLDVGGFSITALNNALAQLRPLLAAPEEIRKVPGILADAGVGFVVLEHLRGTKIDGACFWLPSKAPVVAMSLRYDRIDSFWHTLLHEIYHVKNREGQKAALPVDDDLQGSLDDAARPDNEQKADNFASSFAVPQQQLADFILRVRPFYSKKKIYGFSHRVGVHPGLVVGQLQHRKQIGYAHNRETLVKVRDTLTGSALTDGWGHVAPA